MYSHVSYIRNYLQKYFDIKQKNYYEYYLVMIYEISREWAIERTIKTDVWVENLKKRLRNRILI